MLNSRKLFTPSLSFALLCFMAVWFNTNRVIGQTPWENITPLKSYDILKCSFVLDDTTAFIGGPSSVLLSTKDHGELWTRSINYGGSFPVNGVIDIHFFDAQNGLIAAGGGEMYTTNDGGLTWNQSYNSGYLFNEMVFISPTDGFICGLNGVLLKTTDAGVNWSLIPTGVTSQLYSISFATSTNVYMSTNNGEVLKSVDTGNTWTIVNNSLPQYLTSVAFVGDTGLVACSNQGVYRTVDGGVSWTSLTVPPSTYFTDVYFTETMTVFALGWNGLILRSDDAGATFTQIVCPVSADLKGIMKFPSGVLNLYGEWSLMESFDNGLTWSMRLRGVRDSKLSRIRFNNDSTAYCVGRYESSSPNSTILRTNDDARYWSTQYGSSSSSTAFWDISFANDSVGFVGAQNSIWKTTDSGSSWGTNSLALQNRAVFCVDANNILVGNYNNGVYRSSNGGSSWNLVYTPPFSGVNRFSFLNSQVGLAGISAGRVAKTTDGGLTWTEIYDPALPVSATIDIDFVNDTLVYSLSNASALFKSTDAGLTWTSVGSINSSVQEIIVPDPNFPDSLFCLTLNGRIRKSIDGGASWTTVLTPAPNLPMQVYDFVIHQNTFYACGSGGDIYRSKFNCAPLAVNKTIAVCDASQIVLPNGQVVENSGTYTYTKSNPHTCDSIITASIIFSNSVTVNDTIETCASFTWNGNGQTYTNSGDYTSTLSTAQGCDSIMMLHLTILPSYSASSNVTSCVDYFWAENGTTYTNSGQYSETYTSQNGCDSIVSINLTILPVSSSTETISACDNYIWSANGQSYSSSGLYSDTLSSVAGCDSIVSLDLTIDYADTSVVFANDSTLAGVPGGDSYQWLDCSNSYAQIAGETNINLTSSQTGLFALEVTSGGCVDTSACYLIDPTSSLSEGWLTDEISLYPNPTKGKLKIGLGSYNGPFWLKQMKISGELIQEMYFPNVQNVESILKGVPGLYRIQLELDDGRFIERLVLLVQ